MSASRLTCSQKWEAAGVPAAMHARAAALAFAAAPRPVAARATMVAVAIQRAEELFQAPDKALLVAVAAAQAAAAAT